jgi:AcrR family transcriptional regulator
MPARRRKIPGSGSLRAPRSAGRPAGAEADDVRRALLEAAERLFAVQGFKGVPVRAIADAAGVNPAMIHYYFGDKQGLHQAVLENALQPLFDRLRGWVESRESERGDIRVLVDVYVRAVATRPWIPALLMREVLAHEGPFRERFVREIAPRGAGTLVRAIASEQAAGRLRADLDPKLAALSLVSMALFPFLALPIARDVFGLRLDGADLERLIEHTERMFLLGAEA